MRHTNGLITISEALHRVFIDAIVPAAARYSDAVLKRRPIPPHWPCRSTPIPTQSQQCCRAFTSRTVNHTPPIYDTQNTQPRISRLPQDEEIKAFKVHLRRPEDGRLSDPIPTYEALQLRQRDERGQFTEYMQEVAPQNAAQGRHFPICRMVDKKAERAKQKSDKGKKMQTKQLEFTWTIGDNDLSHRLQRLKEFLEKGYRVEILFGAKRKGWKDRRDTTQEDVRRVQDKIKGTVGEVEGAKEWKAMRSQEGKPVMLSYEGKAKN